MLHIFLHSCFTPALGGAEFSIFPWLRESLLLSDGVVSPEIVPIYPKMPLSRTWEGLCLGSNPAGCDGLGAPHENNFINVRETTGGLDVKNMIKCFVLLSLKYINRLRLQGA